MPRKALTRIQVRRLCDAAQAAWDKRPPGITRAEFTWQDEPYAAIRVEAEFRLAVGTIDGQSVASQYD
jgi:hypothetical protein